MDEVAEQQEAARRFEAAIAALEPLLVQSDDGQFSFDEADLSALDVAPDDLQSLVDSVADLNSALSSGELALSDINVVTPEVANG